MRTFRIVCLVFVLGCGAGGKPSGPRATYQGLTSREWAGFFYDRDFNDRQRGQDALMNLGDADAISIFTECLSGDDADLRHRSVRMLGVLRITASIPKLQAMLRAATDQAERNELVIAIQQAKNRWPVGPNGRGQYLPGLVKDADPEVRLQALRAGQFELTNDNIGLVIDLSNDDPDPQVKARAAEVVKEFFDARRPRQGGGMQPKPGLGDPRDP